MSLLDAAHAYAAHGWPVFTLRGKVPAVAKRDGGRGFLDASTDPAVIEAMWQRHPGANIGLRTGAAAGIAVLDVDPRHGGGDSLTRIETDLGVLPGTVLAITGGGGLHLFYRHQSGLGITPGNWGPGLDLRGEGGYVVAAPSVHPETHQAYRWLGDVWNEPLAAWPAQLPLRAGPALRPVASPPSLLTGGTGALAGLVRTVLGAAEGQRNTTLNWAAHKAGLHVQGGRLDFRQAAAALYEAALQIGLSHTEAVRTIASGLGSVAA